MILNINDFYIPNFNSFAAPAFWGVPFTLFVSCLMFLLALFLKEIRTKDAAMILICLLVIGSIFIQFIAQVNFKSRVAQLMSQKNTAQKKEYFFGSSSDLAYCALHKLKGAHYQGEFISDLDSSSIDPSVFRYELYPVVDLISKGPHPDVRICFYSSQCAEVPEDFHILCQIKGGNGYVALRKEAYVQIHHPH
jgi:hypothetical protein